MFQHIFNLYSVDNMSKGFQLLM